MQIKQKLLREFVRYRIKGLALISTEQAASYAFKLFCTPQSTVQIPTPAIFQQAEKFSFTSTNHTIQGYRWNAGAAHQILIVHGFSSSGKKFAHLIEPLLSKGYAVSCFDAPAHGSSSGKTVHALTYAQCIKDFLKEYGMVDGIIAHSFGGLATVLALKDIQPNNQIRTVLFAPATESTTQLDLFTNYFSINTSVKKEMLNLVKEISNTSLDNISITKHIDALHGPVYWFHDENDPITPFQEAKAVAENGQKNIHFFATKGLGHSGLYKDSQNCEKVLEIFNF